jgi:hypothetical protein
MSCSLEASTMTSRSGTCGRRLSRILCLATRIPSHHCRFHPTRSSSCPTHMIRPSELGIFDPSRLLIAMFAHTTVRQLEWRKICCARVGTSTAKRSQQEVVIEVLSCGRLAAASFLLSYLATKVLSMTFASTHQRNLSVSRAVLYITCCFTWLGFHLGAERISSTFCFPHGEGPGLFGLSSSRMHAKSSFRLRTRLAWVQLEMFSQLKLQQADRWMCYSCFRILRQDADAG